MTPQAVGSNEVIAILQLCIGSGILVLMLRIAMQVGRYSARLETLETAFVSMTRKVDDIHRDVIRLVAVKDDRGTRHPNREDLHD